MRSPISCALMRWSLLLLALLTISVVSASSSSAYSLERKAALRQRVTDLFRHGYESYMTHAFPMDELKPLSCKGTDHFGGYTLTLIDSLDMLALTGDDEEFMKQCHYVAKHVRFDRDMRVSVFETTIRILGGLVSAHQLAERVSAKYSNESWATYSGELLRSAVDIADRLVPAFDTPTGIPYNEVNLRRGVEPSRGQTTCPAAAGSLLLEFGVLSSLTGNCTYATLASRALDGIWKHRSRHNLVGTMIDVVTGRWINVESNIGASVDSFYEYIYKAYVLFGDEKYLAMWEDAYKAIQKYTFFSGWYLSSSVDVKGPLSQEHKFNSLQAFWPGLQVLAGDVHSATMAYEKMYCIVRDLNVMPEYVNIDAYLRKEAHTRRNGPGYPLRPEFLESTYFLHRATGEDRFLEIAEDFIATLERTKQGCGFAAVVDVFDWRFEDKMDSFVLAETFKYLYLIFSPTKEDVTLAKRRGQPAPEPLAFDLEDDFLVNTEAHPLHINREQRAVYERCVRDAPGVRLPRNDKRIHDDFLVHADHEYEKCTKPTKHEAQRQCAAIDYMRDVVPFLNDVDSKDRCYAPVHMRVLGQTHVVHRPHHNVGSRNNEPDVKQVTLQLPADVRTPWSPEMRLMLSYKGPEIKTTLHRGVLEVPRAGPEMLYMHSHLAAIHVPLADGSNASFMTGGANFGPSMCAGSESAPEAAPFGRQAQRGPLLALDGNGCHSSALDESGQRINRNVIDTTLVPVDELTGAWPPFGILISRGGCPFKEKVMTAQQLGATFAVIYNNDDSGVTVMADTEVPKEFPIAIPSLFVAKEAGDHLVRCTKSNAPGATCQIRITCATKAEEQFAAMGVVLSPHMPTKKFDLERRVLYMHRTRHDKILRAAKEASALRAILEKGITAEPNLLRLYTDYAESFPNSPRFQVFVAAKSSAAAAAPGCQHANRYIQSGLTTVSPQQHVKVFVDTDPSAVFTQCMNADSQLTKGCDRRTEVENAMGFLRQDRENAVISVTTFHLRNVPDAARRFLAIQEELLDALEDMSRKNTSYVNTYYGGVSKDTGKWVEVIMYGSVAGYSVLSTADYENGVDIFDAHVLMDMRSMYVDSATTTVQVFETPIVVTHDPADL